MARIKLGSASGSSRSKLAVLAAFGSLLLGVIAAVTAVGALAASSPSVPSSDPFYSYAGSISGVAPGTVLKQRTVPLVGFAVATSATQVLYRTSNELGRPSITVATIIRPAGAGAATTKLVSYQTAYDSLGPKCDPSYAFRGGDPADNSTNDEEEKLVEAYVTAGNTVVVPDYEGVHWDWTAGQESGYGTLDGIRAAENLLKLKSATTPVGMVGYSGGSIATDFAAELASTYAPGLHIVGVAEGGVPVDFAHNLFYITGSPGWSGVIPGVLLALGHAFGVDISPYLSPLGLKLTRQAAGQCINSLYGAHPGLKYQQLLKRRYQNVFAIGPFAKIVDRLIMSNTGTPKVPLLIGVGNADGTGDGVMVANDDEALAHAFCQRGVPVQFQIYKGDEHTQAALAFEPAALNFLTQRLSGAPVNNGCSSIGAGNSLAPLPIPPTLVVRYLGAVRHLHGVVVRLTARGGTLRNITVTLTRRGHLVARVRIARLSTHRRRVVLRHAGGAVPAGSYTLTVTAGHISLVRRRVHVA